MSNMRAIEKNNSRVEFDFESSKLADHWATVTSLVSRRHLRKSQFFLLLVSNIYSAAKRIEHTFKFIESIFYYIKDAFCFEVMPIDMI